MENNYGIQLNDNIKPSLLIADDVPQQIASIKHSLRSAGFDSIKTASDGLEALKILRERHIDILILDIHMPVITGIELLKCLKAEDISTKVIVISAADSQEQASFCTRLGAASFLSKPFGKQELLQTVSDVLATGKTNICITKEQ